MAFVDGVLGGLDTDAQRGDAGRHGVAAVGIGGEGLGGAAAVDVGDGHVAQISRFGGAELGVEADVVVGFQGVAEGHAERGRAAFVNVTPAGHADRRGVVVRGVAGACAVIHDGGVSAVSNTFW